MHQKVSEAISSYYRGIGSCSNQNDSTLKANSEQWKSDRNQGKRKKRERAIFSIRSINIEIYMHCGSVRHAHMCAFECQNSGIFQIQVQHPFSHVTHLHSLPRLVTANAITII